MDFYGTPLFYWRLRCTLAHYSSPGNCWLHGNLEALENTNESYQNKEKKMGDKMMNCEGIFTIVILAKLYDFIR